jgi:hypothetical protein
MKIKIKRKQGAPNVTSFGAGAVVLQFIGPGPFEIDEDHFKYKEIADSFEKIESTGRKLKAVESEPAAPGGE